MVRRRPLNTLPQSFADRDSSPCSEFQLTSPAPETLAGSAYRSLRERCGALPSAIRCNGGLHIQNLTRLGGFFPAVPSQNPPGFRILLRAAEQFHIALPDRGYWPTHRAPPLLKQEER